MKLVSNVKAKYFKSINQFVKIREFTQEEIDQIFSEVKFTDRRSYIQFVINTCVVNFNDEVLPAIRKAKRDLFHKLEGAEEELYTICISINPALDIEKVTFSVKQHREAPLFLLEKKKQSAHQRIDLIDLEERLRKRVIGQDEAVKKVANAVKRALVGLRNPEKPIGSFMFIGQTGVGKTELAKALSAQILENEEEMVRIDCSEFSQPHEYAKLLGAPPGYIGFEEGGVLSDALTRGKMQVVLFDEIEKAHPRVHNLLLQVLDEGFVHDSHGKKIPFQDAIIILTSNVGSFDLEKENHRIGFSKGDFQSREKERGRVVRKALERIFPPEFLNRLDEIVLFHALPPEDVEKIVDVFLEELRQRLAKMGFAIEFGSDVKRFLAQRGYDDKYGVRPLKRTIQRFVETPLSHYFLKKGVGQSGRIETFLKNEEIGFHWLPADFQSD
ncbi:MAG: ATP-dependent Clp protease ATP-binding subunit [Calditrichaeota bacterium]|nr:ATP-dependent Clp protease ATP-binding subunit [Calditrichota bacterium]